MKVEVLHHLEKLELNYSRLRLHLIILHGRNLWCWAGEPHPCCNSILCATHAQLKHARGCLLPFLWPWPFKFVFYMISLHTCILVGAHRYKVYSIRDNYMTKPSSPPSLPLPSHSPILYFNFAQGAPLLLLIGLHPGSIVTGGMAGCCHSLLLQMLTIPLGGLVMLWMTWQ